MFDPSTTRRTPALYQPSCAPARLVNITPLSAWTELSPTDISYCLRLKKESEVDIEIVAWNVACLWAFDLLCWYTMKHNFTVFNQQLACNGTSSPPCCILCRLLAFLLSLQLYIVNVLPDIIFAIIFFFHFIRCHLLSSTQPNYIRFLLSIFSDTTLLERRRICDVSISMKPNGHISLPIENTLFA